MFSNLIVDDLTPKVSKEFEKLVPRQITASSITFNLSDVSSSEANAIRRTASCELEVKCLTFDLDDMTTDDPFCISSMIQSRLRLLTIAQDIPEDVVFELNAMNTTSEWLNVYTRDLKLVKGKCPSPPFNENIIICRIYSGHEIRIKGIHVVRGFGYDFAGFCLTSNATSVALDIEPFNAYTNEGIRSHVANPREWRISFISNGGMKPLELIRAIITSIIDRIEQVRNLLPTITEQDMVSVLVIPGESDTVGHLLMQKILEIKPDIEAVIYSVGNTERLTQVRLRTGGISAATIFGQAIDKIVEKFTKIRSQVK